MGLLKEELRRLDSLILRCADATRGGRRRRAGGGPGGLCPAWSPSPCWSHPNITVVPGEVTAIPEGNVVIATGPLTSDALADAIAEHAGRRPYAALL